MVGNDLEMRRRHPSQIAVPELRAERSQRSLKVGHAPMETQTALSQILANEVGRLKRVEFLEARLQTRPFPSFGTGHRGIPQEPCFGVLKREPRSLIFSSFL